MDLDHALLAHVGPYVDQGHGRAIHVVQNVLVRPKGRSVQGEDDVPGLEAADGHGRAGLRGACDPQREGAVLVGEAS